jgi:hypothetical protein
MTPYLITPTAEARPWRPTTLWALGHKEIFLEEIIATNPAVLGLDPYETGITKSVVAFRQTRLETPTGRTVIPDVVLLSESGHIVIVEVKRAGNPELKDRRIVAQVVEYAASVANLSDDELLTWLRAENDESWVEFVRRIFPNAEAPDRLSTALRRRIREAELHLVIACDRAPDGLRDLVRAVAGQAALGAFKLHVVELRPYVAEGVTGVLLVPASVLQTEVVARTAITVSYADGKQPGVSVVASSAEEVAEAIKEVQAKRPMRPEFAAVVDRYDALAPDSLRTIGRSAAYKQIHPPEWPAGIHYEFLDRRGPENVGVELHVEKKALTHISAELGPLAQEIGAIHDPQWSLGRGRIRREVPLADADGAARAMLKLIDQTRKRVTELLEEDQPSMAT